MREMSTQSRSQTRRWLELLASLLGSISERRRRKRTDVYILAALSGCMNGDSGKVLD